MFCRCCYMRWMFLCTSTDPPFTAHTHCEMRCLGGTVEQPHVRERMKYIYIWYMNKTMAALVCVRKNATAPSMNAMCTKRSQKRVWRARHWQKYRTDLIQLTLSRTRWKRWRKKMSLGKISFHLKNWSESGRSDCRNVINLIASHCVYVFDWNNESILLLRLLLLLFSVDERKRNSLVTDAILPPKIQSRCFFFVFSCFSLQQTDFYTYFFFRRHIFNPKIVGTWPISLAIYRKIERERNECKLFNHIAANEKRKKEKKTFSTGKTTERGSP